MGKHKTKKNESHEIRENIVPPYYPERYGIFDELHHRNYEPS